MLKIGDIVFFRRYTRSAKLHSPEMGFTKHVHGFGICLGMMQSFTPDPPPPILFQLLGKAGLVSFDDIRQFAGEEVMQDIANKFAEKYYGAGLAKLIKDLQKPDAAKLVDPSGNEMQGEVN